MSDNKFSYQTTHPWLTFNLDFSAAPVEFWMLLGEASSKCDHIAGVPLKGTTAEELNRVYLAKGAHATTAIEGNTLSEGEVLQLMDGTLKLPPSRQYLAEEVSNVLRICNELATQVHAGKLPALTPELITEYNGRVLAGLTLDEGVVPGMIRKHSVGIQVANYRGAPWEDCPYLLVQLCENLNGPAWNPERFKDQPVAMAIIKSILAHVYLAWIHPYGDGNGRTARLVEWHILLAAGVPIPAAHLLSNHYNGTRAQYYRELARASQSGGDVMPFMLYAVRGFVDGLRAQLTLIRNQQWSIAWESYVYERFRDAHGFTADRRRHLLLDLSVQPKPVARSEIRRISARVAEAYARKTDMTLIRDLNELERMELAERTPEGWRAKREIVLAFLPWKIPN